MRLVAESSAPRSGIFGPTCEGPAYDLLEDLDEYVPPERQIDLARDALRLDQNCIPAYLILADFADTQAERRALVAEAVAAGYRVWGDKPFARDNGVTWWWHHGTRPFMVALEWHAIAQFEIGNRAEAIRIMMQLLRANPNDSQGNRFHLVGMLIADGQYERARHLVNRYAGETGAFFPYTRALLLFQEGRREAAEDALREGYARNRHIPDYLAEVKSLPFVLPRAYSKGSDEEAVFYAEDMLPAWQAVPGAREWLEKTLDI